MADSRCFRAFCGFGIDEKSSRKSALQENIKRVQPETIELVNRLILAVAAEMKVENGRKSSLIFLPEGKKSHRSDDSSPSHKEK